MPYVNGLGVHSIMRIERVGDWKNVTDQTSSRLPTFRRAGTGETIRVEVASHGNPPYKAFHHRGGSSSLQDPLFTAVRDKKMAEQLRSYFKNGFSGVSL